MLLDVNVLLALAWPNHQYHADARSWFSRRHSFGWSTCALTELGFIRISSNPAFTEHARTPEEALHLLAALTAVKGHRYLGELPAPSELDRVWQSVRGHRQTTDVYLAAVALHHDTKLGTFDHKLFANPAVREAVELIGKHEATP